MEIRVEKWVVDHYAGLSPVQLIERLFDRSRSGTSVVVNGIEYPSYTAAARCIQETYSDVTVTHIRKKLARDGRFKEFTLDSSRKRQRVEKRLKKIEREGYSCAVQ